METEVARRERCAHLLPKEPHRAPLHSFLDVKESLNLERLLPDIHPLSVLERLGQVGMVYPDRVVPELETNGTRGERRAGEESERGERSTNETGDGLERPNVAASVGSRRRGLVEKELSREEDAVGVRPADEAGWR